MADNIGRPAYNDDWYKERLSEMEPILKLGNSLHFAAVKSGNESHETTFRDKANLKDWFSRKIEQYQSWPAEVLNNVNIKLLNKVYDKVATDLPITRDDIEILKMLTDKLRTAQKYYASRQETASAKPIDELLAELDTIDDVAESAKQQMVATQPPIQNKEQTGSTSDVSTQSDAGAVSD